MKINAGQHYLHIEEKDLERLSRRSFAASMIPSEYAEYFTCTKDDRDIYFTGFFGIDFLGDGELEVGVTSLERLPGIDASEGMTATIIDETGEHEESCGDSRRDLILIEKVDKYRERIERNRLFDKLPEVVKLARGRKNGYIGFFHSHPFSYASFSKIDLESSDIEVLVKSLNLWEFPKAAKKVMDKYMKGEENNFLLSSAIEYCRQLPERMDWPDFYSRMAVLVNGSPERRANAERMMTNGVANTNYDNKSFAFDPSIAKPDYIKKMEEIYVRNLLKNPGRFVDFKDGESAPLYRTVFCRYKLFIRQLEHVMGFRIRYKFEESQLPGGYEIDSVVVFPFFRKEP